MMEMNKAPKAAVPKCFEKAIHTNEKMDTISGNSRLFSLKYHFEKHNDSVI